MAVSLFRSQSFSRTIIQYDYLLSSSRINHLLFIPPLTGPRNEVQVRRIIRSAINQRYVYSLKHCAGGPNIARGIIVRVFSLSIVIVIFQISSNIIWPPVHSRSFWASQPS